MRRIRQGAGRGFVIIFVRNPPLRRLIEPVSLPTENLDAIFAAWVRDHRGILVKVARSYATVAADQDELFQELLLQLWRSLPRFLGQCAPPTWIYRVCLNTALTWQRTVRRRDYLLTPLDGRPEPACARPQPPAIHEHGELLEALYVAVRKLPPTERALVLLLLDGLSYRDIGEITGLTENHVGVALTRARKKLTESLKEVRDEL